MMQQPGRPPSKLALPDILQALSRMLPKAQWVPVQLVLQKWKTVSDQKLPLRTVANAGADSQEKLDDQGKPKNLITVRAALTNCVCRASHPLLISGTPNRGWRCSLARCSKQSISASGMSSSLDHSENLPIRCKCDD